MKKIFFLIAFLILVCLFGTALAQNGPLVSKMDVMKVITDKETGKEKFETVEGDVYPEEVLIYILTYENVGEEVIKNLKPVGPVPEGTKYIQDSAVSSVDAGLEFSIDGGETYQSPPVMYKKVDLDGKEIEVEATPDMYTNVRWTVRFLKIGEKITLKYRVKVK